MAIIFQYGSNTDTTLLNAEDRLKGQARCMGLAVTVEPYVFKLGVPSEKHGCTATIERGGSDCVWGVLYEVPDHLIERDDEKPPRWKSLDQIEAEGKNTRRATIRVRMVNGEEVSAITYVGMDTQEGLKTTTEYGAYILRGLKNHEAPGEYVERVREVIIASNPAINPELLESEPAQRPEPDMKPILFLPRRHSWFLRIIRGPVPVQPETGDKEPVMHTLHEIVDAAGGLEHSREAFRRVITIAQEEFTALCTPPFSPNWTGANTPAVYYEFSNAVTWTRTVDDRYKDQLRPAVQHDQPLCNKLQRIRSEEAGSEFEDARLLAKCGLHKFTPPYANAGAKVEGATLIYPVVDRIIDPENFRANLRFASGRHAATVIEKYWEAVAGFIERLLDVFYPPAP